MGDIKMTTSNTDPNIVYEIPRMADHVNMSKRDLPVMGLKST